MAEDKEYEQVYDNIDKKMAEDGMTAEEAKEAAMGEYLADNRIFNEDDQKDWRHNFEDYYEDRKAREAQEAQEKPFKDVYDNIDKKMKEDGMTFEEAKEAAVSEHLADNRILDEDEQEAWRNSFEDYYEDRKAREAQEAHDKPFKDMYESVENKVKEGMTEEEAKDEAVSEYLRDNRILNEDEQQAWRDSFEDYYEDRKAREDGEYRDKLIRHMYRDLNEKVAAGADREKAKDEVLNDFFTKNKVTDPKEQAAWKKDFETYPQRQAQKNAEKEKAVEADNKKSGRKVLQNGVVSKWLSRNKDKLVLATTAVLGTAWTASAVSSAAGMGGLGLLPTIQVLGVSSTVFPPALAAGALLVAGYYVKKVLDARKAEKEAEKGKQGNTNANPFNTANKQGGR